MAESTTTRLALPRWTAAGDTLNRAELDTAFANLEARVPRYANGTLAARPAAAAAYAGTYYTVTDATGGGVLGTTYFCDGATWLTVGSASSVGFAELYLHGGF